MPTKRVRVARTYRVGLHDALFQVLAFGVIENEDDRSAFEFWPEQFGAPERFRPDDALEFAAVWRARRDEVRRRWFAENGDTPESRRAFRERDRAILAAETARIPNAAHFAAAQVVAILAERARTCPRDLRVTCPDVVARVEDEAVRSFTARAEARAAGENLAPWSAVEWLAARTDGGGA